MRISAKNATAALGKPELLVVLAAEKRALDLPKGVELSKAARDDFRGEFRQKRVCDPAAGPAARVLLVGLGKRADLDAERLRRAAAIGVKYAESAKHGSAVVWCSHAAEIEKAVGDADALGCALAEGARMGAYSYQACKSKPSKPKLARVAFHGDGAAFRRGVERGDALASGNAFARDLGNAPANKLRPRDMVAEARKVARRSERIRCRVLDEKSMERLGMGSLLSVSRGSEEPAYLIHLTYKPAGRAKGRVAFVGKGLTFDSGGISIKPSPKMDEMKYDMCGAAAVLGVFHVLGSLDVPFEVHGIVGTTENMPSGSATKPGDVVQAMNGTTIEVLNTDAEGRLVLADALAYATTKVKPDTVIDLATLTGAVVVALGHELTGMFASTPELERDLRRAGEAVHELVWPLPLLECHREQMKGTVADLRNINAGQGNGSTAGAAFLANFVGDAEWCHLDIAGAAWGGIDRDYVGGPQGSGVGVRLLMQYLEERR